MAEQAAPELPAQPRRQRDPPVRGVADYQIETFPLGCLLKTVAYAHDGLQPCPCLTAQIAERGIKEHQ